MKILHKKVTLPIWKIMLIAEIYSVIAYISLYCSKLLLHLFLDIE